MNLGYTVSVCSKSSPLAEGHVIVHLNIAGRVATYYFLLHRQDVLSEGVFYKLDCKDDSKICFGEIPTPICQGQGWPSCTWLPAVLD